MSKNTFDFKKEFKELYLPKNHPVLIDVPAMQFIMVDGCGDPNNNETFSQAVELLYGLSYAIKMSKMKGNQPQGYFEYVVPPLEGLWWVNDRNFSLERRNNWEWTVMIRQPDFVVQEVFERACSELKRKKPAINADKAYFGSFEEGLCVQMMHVGPFADEPETKRIMEGFMAENHLKDRISNGGKHHEIYITDPNKTSPDKMKTVLRNPVSR